VREANWRPMRKMQTLLRNEIKEGSEGKGDGQSFAREAKGKCVLEGESWGVLILAQGLGRVCVNKEREGSKFNYPKAIKLTRNQNNKTPAERNGWIRGKLYNGVLLRALCEFTAKVKRPVIK